MFRLLFFVCARERQKYSKRVSEWERVRGRERRDRRVENAASGVQRMFNNIVYLERHKYGRQVGFKQ